MSSVNTDYRIETRIFTRAFPQIIRSLPYPPSFPPEKNFAKRRKSALSTRIKGDATPRYRLLLAFSLEAGEGERVPLPFLRHFFRRRRFSLPLRARLHRADDDSGKRRVRGAERNRRCVNVQPMVFISGRIHPRNKGYAEGIN